MKIIYSNPPALSRDTFNYTLVLRASSGLTLNICRDTLTVYSDLNRPILSFYKTLQNSYHLLTPTCTGASSAPGRLDTHTASPHPPIQGHPAQLWLLFRPSQNGQNLLTSACKNKTQIGSNLSFGEQHSHYRTRALT